MDEGCSRDLETTLSELEPSRRRRFLERKWHAENDARVRQAMTTYVRGLCEWQVFATLTFAPKVNARLVVSAQDAPKIVRQSEKEPQTNEQFAQRVVCRFVQRLNEKFWGNRYYRRTERVKLFVPWERQKWDALHCHPLIGGMPIGGEMNADDELGLMRAEEWRFEEIHEAWREAQRDFGLQPGFAWLKPYVAGRVDGYVAKYVTKDLTGDAWALFGFECEGSNRG